MSTWFTVYLWLKFPVYSVLDRLNEGILLDLLYEALKSFKEFNFLPAYLESFIRYL